MGRLGRGVFECAVDNDRQLHGLVGQKDRSVMEREIAWMKELSIRTGRPVTFGFVQNRSDPDGWRYWLELVAEANAAGADIRPQTTTRGIGVLFGLANRTPFDNCSAAWRSLRAMPYPEKLARLADPAFKAQLAADAAKTPSKLDLSGIYRLDDSRVSYEADPAETLVAHADRRAVFPAEAFLDMAMESGAKGSWNYPFLNWDFDAIEAKIKDPSVILGIGDAGAHVGQIQDASQSTYFLTRWVRDAKKWSIEEAVAMLAADGAGQGDQVRHRTVPGLDPLLVAVSGDLGVEVAAGRSWPSGGLEGPGHAVERDAHLNSDRGHRNTSCPSGHDLRDLGVSQLRRPLRRHPGTSRSHPPSNTTELRRPGRTPWSLGGENSRSGFIRTFRTLRTVPEGKGGWFGYDARPSAAFVG